MARRSGNTNTTRDISYAAAGVALMAVSAWITIPVGLVPFTLQTMAAVFLVNILSERSLRLAMLSYVFLGAIGLPVFSGMRGGIGVLFGPTGGFILALIPAGILAQLICKHIQGRVGKLVGGYILVAVMYVLGWAWLMVSAQLGPVQAFASACAPFILPDVIKVIAGIGLSETVSLVAPSLVQSN